jgi:arylsulfatase A-like enzyme
MGDGQIAAWAADRLRRPSEQPSFIGVGFYRPHIPLFAPKKYFDLYAGMNVKLPPVKDDDLNDLGPTARKRALEAETAGSHATVVKFNQWERAVRAYLACVSFIDAQVGKLLDALDNGPSADNTLIVLWGDHGWHLGEKQHWGKWTGWQRATHIPLIIVPPRNSTSDGYQIGGTCSQPVSLIDIYPTLIDVCGLPAQDGLSGQSLAPLMHRPRQTIDRAVISSFDRGNYSVMTSRWHFIRYADGSEELYDLPADPNEWFNLGQAEEHAALRKQLAEHLPTLASADVPTKKKAATKTPKK